MMVASGFAGLGYQIVWTQKCSSWLGHESAALLAVVAAFFGGLAVGSLAFGKRIERSARPLFWYVGCELVVAVWSIGLHFMWSPCSHWALDATGVEPSAYRQWGIAFWGTFAVLLPATAAMGSTVPAMERLTASVRSHGRSIAGFYASNTFGAVFGMLASAFWLIPAIGLARTAALCIVLNLICAATAMAVFQRTAELSSPPNLDRVHARGAMVRLALTGFLGIGYEVLVVRVLSQITEDTVYTFAILLAVYLVGSAVGAAAYERWLAKKADQEGFRDRLLCSVAAACLASTASLWGAEIVKDWAMHAFGSTLSSALGAETLLAVMAFGLPSLMMGALFSQLSQSANAAGISFGRAIGVNMVAAAAAPALFGIFAVPLLGLKLALLLIALGYIALTARAAWSRNYLWGPAVGVIALLIFAPPLTFITVSNGGRIVRYDEGIMASVSVVEDASGVARLRINNRQQEGSSATERVDGRQAWLPLLLHPSPRRALFLGLGTGITAASASEDPTLSVDAVELLPEVVAASPYFTRRLEGGAGGARLHVVVADARRYVRASDRLYDVIVSDNFHPARSGSGALYTVEHFEAVRLRLDSHGVFCQWLPLHQLDLTTVRSIVRSFVTVYPQAWAIIASNSLETPVLGLVARRDDDRFDLPRTRDRLSHLTLPQRVTSLGFEDELAVLGSFVAGPASLDRFAADARANTDDHPVVAYGAPRITYAPDSSPRDRLIALLHEISIEPSELLSNRPDIESARRLAAYWKARDQFVETGRNVRPSQRVLEMLGQVREPLLSVLRISPDFRPAYDPLLSMAGALMASNASSAQDLLRELIRIQPARVEAGRLLARADQRASGLDISRAGSP